MNKTYKPGQAVICGITCGNIKYGTIVRGDNTKYLVKLDNGLGEVWYMASDITLIP